EDRSPQTHRYRQEAGQDPDFQNAEHPGPQVQEKAKKEEGPMAAIEFGERKIESLQSPERTLRYLRELSQQCRKTLKQTPSLTQNEKKHREKQNSGRGPEDQSNRKGEWEFGQSDDIARENHRHHRQDLERAVHDDGGPPDLERVIPGQEPNADGVTAG